MSVHIASVKTVSLFVLGECTVYTIMSATDTSQGEVFLPKKISERGSFEFQLADLSGKHMQYVGMLLVHGAQMCSGEQAIKIDNKRAVAVLLLHFFFIQICTLRRVLQKHFKIVILLFKNRATKFKWLNVDFRASVDPQF